MIHKYLLFPRILAAFRKVQGSSTTPNNELRNNGYWQGTRRKTMITVLTIEIIGEDESLTLMNHRSPFEVHPVE